MNSAEMGYAVGKLKRAFLRLKGAVEEAVDDLDRDGTIQRFEFTFELLWKAIKVILEYEGLYCAGPRSCIKEAARRGFLVDGEILLDMLEDRNKSTHIYDEETANEIFERIRDCYVGAIERNVTLFEDFVGVRRRDENE